MLFFLIVCLVYTIFSIVLLNSFINFIIKIFNIRRVSRIKKIYLFVVFSIIYFLMFYIVESGGPSTIYGWYYFDFIIITMGEIGGLIVLCNIITKILRKKNI